MITDQEWNIIRQKVFPSRAIQAPPFLWTRILSGIESEENRRSSVWWMQWHWMSRVTIAAGLLISMGAFYLFQTAMPLDAALEGRSSQDQAIQLASADTSNVDESAVLIVGLDS